MKLHTNTHRPIFTQTRKAPGDLVISALGCCRDDRFCRCRRCKPPLTPQLVWSAS